MKRLLDDFNELFDLDTEVRGERIGDLIERAVVDLDASPHPDWGSPGPAGEIRSARPRRFLRFYYMPHLYPEMDLKLRLAHKLQFHLLPRAVPDAAPFSIAAVLESYCHLSGDLFGWEMLSDGKFLLWIVDLSGHGVQSGLASATLKVIIQHLRKRSRVELLVSELNTALNRCARSESLFATGFFMVVAPEGSAFYTSAGHPPALVCRPGGALRMLSPNAKPIGLFPEGEFGIEETRFEAGDTLLLYTDGVVEETDETGEPFGTGRLREFLENAQGPPEALTEQLYGAIAGHHDMAKLTDDLTFLVARFGRE